MKPYQKVFVAVGDRDYSDERLVKDKKIITRKKPQCCQTLDCLSEVADEQVGGQGCLSEKPRMACRLTATALARASPSFLLSPIIHRCEQLLFSLPLSFHSGTETFTA
jgi:hypothetical protein